MTEFSDSEIRRLDLTLLLIFLGLIRHRKARPVASELGMTQSAVSQALKRLRDIFRDELFIRRPHGMEPTAAALALEAPVAEAVHGLRTAIGRIQGFSPASAGGVVRLAALDSEQAVLIPALAGHLASQAPGLHLSVLPISRAEAVQAMLEGRIDLSLGFIWEYPATICRQLLYEDGFLVAGHPDVLDCSTPLDLSDYATADHILVSPRGDRRGVVDDRLEQSGLKRRVVLTMSTFLPALEAAAANGALVTLPSRIVRAFAPRFGLTTAEPPIDIRPVPISVFWHRRDDADPKRIWLCNQLVRISG